MKKFTPHIRKLAVISAVGLISSNLLSAIPNPVYADDWNTATLSSGADGITITYDGHSYTVASSDQSGTYYWGNNIAGDTTTYYGSENNDRWGGGSDTASNGYNPNPTNYDARQGPCDPGYHVPSIGEWNAIMTAWCHLGTNGCESTDISDGYINSGTLASVFKLDFRMTNGGYWSSSPDADYGDEAWFLDVGNYGASPAGYYRDSTSRVRCVKNSTSAGGSSSSSVLTWDEVESGSAAGTLTANPLSFIMPNHDAYLYAITAPNTYHVHYEGNGATAGTMTDSDYTYSVAGTLKANAFSKTGYTWTGWNTQANGGGTHYGAGATVYNWTATDGATIPIYAQWSVNGYEITYLLNSGTVSPANPATYTIETATFTLNNPTRTNSTFLGWSGTNITGLSGTVKIAQGSIGNRTYEANFACNTGYHLSGINNCVNNTYNVVVHNEDGTHGVADPVTFTYDNTGSLPKMPSQSGYNFVGWEVSGMSGGVTHYIGTITTTGDSYTYSGSTNEFMNLTIENGGTVTLTALWQARNDTKYEIYHYIKDVGANTYTLSGTDYLTGTTDTDVVFTTKLKTFTGFTYSGGYLNGGTTRPAGAGLTTGNINKDGSLKIYLYYDRDNYHVYLSGDAHVDTLSGAGVSEYGSIRTVTATPKEGYHFVRWEKRKSDWTTE